MDPTAREDTAHVRSHVPAAPFATLAGLARHITIAGFSGLIAGVLIGGIGGRLFMRIAGALASEVAQGRTTEAGFTVGEVTFGGTLELIIFIGILSGLAVAVYYVMLFPWLSWLGRWRGLGFGVVAFAAASATSDLMNPDNIDFLILKNEPVVVGMIFLLFIAFGVVIEAAYRAINRYMPAPAATVNPVYYTFTAVGLLMGGAVAVLILTRESCSCDPPLGVGWSILLVGIGTIGWWVSTLVARSPTWLGRVAAVAGYLGLIGVLAFGLVRAVSDAIDIID